MKRSDIFNLIKYPLLSNSFYSILNYFKMLIYITSRDFCKFIEENCEPWICIAFEKTLTRTKHGRQIE